MNIYTIINNLFSWCIQFSGEYWSNFYSEISNLNLLNNWCAFILWKKKKKRRNERGERDKIEKTYEKGNHKPQLSLTLKNSSAMAEIGYNEPWLEIPMYFFSHLDHYYCQGKSERKKRQIEWMILMAFQLLWGFA